MNRLGRLVLSLGCDSEALGLGLALAQRDAGDILPLLVAREKWGRSEVFRRAEMFD